MMDCCKAKSDARNHGMFEGPVGDYWFHDHGEPCKGWPKPKKTLWERFLSFFK